MATKTVLAVAVGPQKDLLIRDKGTLSGVRPYIHGLIDELAARGHQLGAAYVIQYRERDLNTFAAKNGDAVGAFKVDSGSEDDALIFAMSTTIVQAARGITKSIPVVGIVSEPTKEKVHRSANICGVSARRSQTAGDCFQYFLATVPTLKKVMVLHKPGYPPSDRSLALVKKAAKKRGVSVSPVTVKSRADIESKLKAMAKRDPKKPADVGIQVLPVDVFLGAAQLITELAQQQKNLPVFWPITDHVKRDLPSALGGYGVSQRKCGELMAELVEKILWSNGKAAALKHRDAPDDAFEWAVSSAAAKALNIRLPSIR
jgi:ABC-type uncharacterized transport system substrate-binding protein